MTDFRNPTEGPPTPSDAASSTPPPASKAPAPPLLGRAPRPRAVRIRRPVVQGVIVVGALLVSGALAWAFIVQPDLTARAREARDAGRIEGARGAVRPSDRVTDQPASYDRLATEPQTLPDPRTPTDESADPVAGPAASAARVSPSVVSGPRGPSAAQQAAASGLFFANASSATRASPPAPQGSEPSTSPDQRDYAAIYSPHGLLAPISPYELKAGAVIPGVLLTAVDTARPGPVVATVTQNVFDSITGRHLLVPQGARLIGRHEGESAHGDRRAFLVWDRMILPNGKSLLLSEEPGVDAQGAVGVRGQVDRRLGALGLASLLAGAVTTLGELARGGGDDRSFAASAGDAASIEAAQVGGRLIDRELGVQPSIRVRAGAPVRVMITRDLILEPYRR